MSTFAFARETEAGEKLALLRESARIAELQSSHERLGRDCGVDEDGRAHGSDRAYQLRSLAQLFAAAAAEVQS